MLLRCLRCRSRHHYQRQPPKIHGYVPLRRTDFRTQRLQYLQDAKVGGLSIYVVRLVKKLKKIICVIGRPARSTAQCAKVVLLDQIITVPGSTFVLVITTIVISSYSFLRFGSSLYTLSMSHSQFTEERSSSGVWIMLSLKML